MIPEFPEFKKLEITDKNEVKNLISQCPPYSDFNFVSMWAWNTKDHVRISKLNNNLIVRFMDYLTNEPFYSFFGNKKENKTAEELFNFLKKEKIRPFLKLISEEISNNLIKDEYVLLPDIDSYDYVYSVDHLSKMNSWTKNSSGKNVRGFVKKNPNYIIKNESMANVPSNTIKEIFNLMKRWAKNKGIENYSELNEYKALQRIFDLKDEQINIVLIYINNFLIGFTVYEILSSDYAISHFAKADVTYNRGVYDILNWEEAKILNKCKIKYFNWEQDLGILELRKAKEKYKPSFLLKKFIMNKKIGKI